MHIVAHLLRHFGIPGACLSVVLLFSPAGCEDGFGGNVIRHCHAPVEHSLSIDEVRGELGVHQVRVWGGSTAMSFGDYKFLTTTLMAIVGILAFVGMWVVAGNPFKWPGETGG